jgi:hypothetical protein
MSTPPSPPLDTTTCVVCGRPYRRASKPVWASDPGGRIIGTAHSTCAPYSWEGGTRRAHEIAVPLEAARFEAWHNAHYHPHSPPYNLLALALIGQEPPQDTPSERQRDLMEHWSRPGNSYGAAGADAAWARYVELVAEYRAWLAAGEVGR